MFRSFGVWTCYGRLENAGGAWSPDLLIPSFGSATHAPERGLGFRIGFRAQDLGFRV